MRAMSGVLEIAEESDQSLAGRWASPSSPILRLPSMLAAALDHHGAIVLLAHAGHRAGHLLKALAVGRADLRQEIDVAAERHHPVEVAVEHRLFLLLGHLPFVEIGALVGLELRAVLGLHQRHAELIEPIAFARLLRVEDDGAGNFLELFVERHQLLPCSGQ